MYKVCISMVFKVFSVERLNLYLSTVFASINLAISVLKHIGFNHFKSRPLQILPLILSTSYDLIAYASLPFQK